MPKVGKKKFPYTKIGVAAANLAAAKSGKKVTNVAKVKAGYADKMQSAYNAAKKTPKPMPKAPKNLERMPRIKTRGK